MESKIIMYDSNGTEVGETYSRRARQLVKQQRAAWADDTHTAIRFAPDAVEEWTPEPAPTAPPVTHAPHPATSDRTGALYALAERRMRDRRRIIVHSLLLIPVFIALFLWGVISYDMARNGQGYLVFMGIGMGAWVTFYISHLRNYIKMVGHLPRPGSWESRRNIALDIEVERLKMMGYKG